jgi:hypothetical protein
MVIFNLKELSNIGVKEKYQHKISTRCTALIDNGSIGGAEESIKRPWRDKVLGGWRKFHSQKDNNFSVHAALLG